MPKSRADRKMRLVNRLGLGVKAAEAAPRWLDDPAAGYVAEPPALARLPRRADAAEALGEFQQSRRAQRMAKRSEEGDDAALQQEYRAARQDIVGLYRQQVAARYAAAVAADNDFAERLVHFWSNHFAVSADNILMTVFAGLQEQEAIRPHIFGRFADMLMAVEHHPAMLVYLNQSTSIGPNSPAAKRRARAGGKPRGLNENLGREILELHTLGVKGGYSQKDVTEFARALTGFTIAGANAGPNAGMNANPRQRATPGDFRFADGQHEPGPRSLLGKNYAQAGEGQANAILSDLAVHPATAKHLSFKLARHFVADDPPPALVERLAKKFLAGQGDLTPWYAELIAAPELTTALELTAANASKYKTPWEWLVSAGRATGLAQFPRPVMLVNLMNELGHPVWKPKSPAGFDDVAASWLASDALMRRVEATPRLVALVPDLPDARALAPLVMGDALRPQTAEALARAEDNKQAMALLLVSPEFLRR